MHKNIFVGDLRSNISGVSKKFCCWKPSQNADPKCLHTNALTATYQVGFPVNTEICAWARLRRRTVSKRAYPPGLLTRIESMYFLLKMGIFQPAMLVSGRVCIVSLLLWIILLEITHLIFFNENLSCPQKNQHGTISKQKKISKGSSSNHLFCGANC